MVLIGSIGIWATVSALWDSPLEVCQKSYMKSTNEITRYNEDNPDYTVSLPEYNCNTLTSTWTHSTGITVPPERQDKEVEELTLRDRFGLGNCRFINEFHRIGKQNLEWIAYDIACDVWVSFDVKSPWEYTIERIGKWANMGEFVILKKTSEVWDEQTRIVLGHTKTTRREWEKLGYNDIVGQTHSLADIRAWKSWESTWVHVHIELWSGYKNVSREFALDKKYRQIDGSALLNYRGWKFWQTENLYTRVKEFECKGWFHLEAYLDYKQYSIGCGTKSFKWEKITQEEAYARFKKEVDRRYVIVAKTYSEMSINKQIALTSLLFNNPECYNYFKNTWSVDVDVWKNKCNKAGGEVLRGLQIRRDKELELFNS